MLCSPELVRPIQEPSWASVVTLKAIWTLAGQPQITVRTVKPPAKVQIPQGEAQEEEEEEQEEQEVETRAGCGELGRAWGSCGSAQRLTVFPVFLVSAVPSSSPHHEEAIEARWGQSCKRG